MQRLGYTPCFHSLTDIAQGVRFPPALFRKIYSTPAPERYSLLRQIYDRYSAACDVPTCLFIEDLVQIYPDAKIILGLRNNAAAWCKSHSETVRISSAYSAFVQANREPQNMLPKSLYFPSKVGCLLG